jgi:hypothetical protein
MKMSEHTTITWRLSTALKTQIETEAAERGMTTSAWLGHVSQDAIARDNKELQELRGTYAAAKKEHSAASKELREITVAIPARPMSVLVPAVDRLTRAGVKLDAAAIEFAEVASKYARNKK